MSIRSSLVITSLELNHIQIIYNEWRGKAESRVLNDWFAKSRVMKGFRLTKSRRVMKWFDLTKDEWWYIIYQKPHFKNYRRNSISNFSYLFLRNIFRAAVGAYDILIFVQFKRMTPPPFHPKNQLFYICCNSQITYQVTAPLLPIATNRFGCFKNAQFRIFLFLFL